MAIEHYTMYDLYSERDHLDASVGAAFTWYSPMHPHVLDMMIYREEL